MPTCWNGDLGTDNDHMDHMAYTVDGTVAGDCPSGFNRRVPQIQIFLRLPNYRGTSRDYILSDGNTDLFHVDFLNGWEDGKLAEIIQNCEIEPHEPSYNPPCNCAEQFLTENTNAPGTVCDSDVRTYIRDEATDVVSALPRSNGACVAPIAKSWDVDPPFTCFGTPSDDAVGDDGGEECEDGGGKFFWRKRERNKILKYCSWLSERNPTAINNICKNRVNYTKKRGTVFPPARVMCKSTCDSCGECYENPKSRFL